MMYSFLLVALFFALAVWGLYAYLEGKGTMWLPVGISVMFIMVGFLFDFLRQSGW